MNTKRADTATDQLRKELPEMSQLSSHKQHLAPMRFHLPEREILRRLWRVYEMALAAANRAEQTEPT
jgi:hypothetical protein